jgi:hypothetical protein
MQPASVFTNVPDIFKDFLSAPAFTRPATEEVKKEPLDTQEPKQPKSMAALMDAKIASPADEKAPSYRRYMGVLARRKSDLTDSRKEGSSPKRDSSPKRRLPTFLDVANPVCNPTAVLEILYDDGGPMLVNPGAKMRSEFFELFEFWATLKTIFPTCRTADDPPTPLTLDAIETYCLVQIGTPSAPGKWIKKYGTNVEHIRIEGPCEIFHISALWLK